MRTLISFSPSSAPHSRNGMERESGEIFAGGERDEITAEGERKTKGEEKGGCEKKKKTRREKGGEKMKKARREKGGEEKRATENEEEEKRRRRGLRC